MYSINVKDIDIGQIAESGQCFRMNYIGKGIYSIIAFGKYLEVSQQGDTLILSCDIDEYKNQREKMKKLFYKYEDGKSCERIAKFLKM